MDIRILNDQDLLWKQIDTRDGYSIYHLKIWKDLIEETFGHKSSYIAASEKEKLVDALPIFIVKNKFLGRKLVSTPYEGCNGGFQSSRSDARNLIIELILKNASEWKVKYVEFRSRFPAEEFIEHGFKEQNPFLITEIQLKCIDENWKMLSSHHRRNVNIAKKKGVSVFQATNWEHMQIFYKIIADHYNRTLGVPFFGLKLFWQIWHKLIKENLACLLLAKYEEKIIGGHLLFFSGNTLISKYMSCIRDSKQHQKLNASYSLNWEAIRLGIENNMTSFNLGITSQQNKGLLQFKSNFGCKPEKLHFYYYPISGEIPNYEKYYDSFSYIKQLWKISPRFVTSIIGPKVNQWIC